MRKLAESRPPGWQAGPSNLKAVHKGWIHLDRIAPIRVVPAPVVSNQPSGLERALANCSSTRAVRPQSAGSRVNTTRLSALEAALSNLDGRTGRAKGRQRPKSAMPANRR